MDNKRQQQTMPACEAGKLFVGGLNWETTEQSLHAYFCRYGEITDCVVMMNNQLNRSRGFGFVTFKDPDSVRLVLANGPHELDGRTIDPKVCNPRGNKQLREKLKNTDRTKVFLGGLPASCTQTDLKNIFSKYGVVLEVQIMFDQENKRPRGFGFVTFESEDSVERLCLEHFVTVNGKQVECKKAEPRKIGVNGQQPDGPWNMAVGDPRGWGPAGPPPPPPPPAPHPPHPGMPSEIPAPPMGPPVGGGPGGYSGGWGVPQHGPYIPQGSYSVSYPTWAPPGCGYSPYNAPTGGGPYGQQTYGYNASPMMYPGFSGGYSNTMSAGAIPGPQMVQGQPGAPGPGSNQGSQSARSSSENLHGGNMGKYQEGSNFGPIRSYSSSGVDKSACPDPSGQGYGVEGPSRAAGSGNNLGRSHAQGYHPYRR